MTPGIRVGVNLLWCRPGLVGGSEEYLTRQLLGLRLVDPEAQSIIATVYASGAYAAAHREIATGFTLESPPLPTDRRALRIALEHSWLQWRTRDVDVVHHGGGTAPAGGRAPVVLTIHDLQYLRFPQYFSRLRLGYLRRTVPRSVHRATVVTTPTHYVAARVVEAFGIDPGRVVVVPHGIAVADPDEPHFVEQAHIDRVRNMFDLGERPYVVYPAITHPHKNHTMLIEALARTHDDLVLIAPGGRGAADDEVIRAISRHGLTERVIRPGRLSDLDRDAVIAGARALVFPSRYEGFGAPLIEAMALGTPVICSDHPAVREVVGDAAVILDADDVDRWAVAMTRIDERRAELVTAGRRRVAEFGLEVSGAALAAAYHQAAQR